jgi:hypothetical protein
MKHILLGQALSEMNAPGAVFSIAFRKDNGELSEKHGVMNRAKHLNNRKKFNRDGLLKCWQPQANHTFDCTIDLIVRFNGMTIIRPE